MGLVTPLGCGVDATWKRLLAGESGARRVEEFEVDDLACQIASFIPRGDGTNGTFKADDWMQPKEQRKVDDFIVYAVAAADQAINDEAGLFDDASDRHDVGVLIGSGIGGLQGIAETSLLLKEKKNYQKKQRNMKMLFLVGKEMKRENLLLHQKVIIN